MSRDVDQLLRFFPRCTEVHGSARKAQCDRAQSGCERRGAAPRLAGASVKARKNGYRVSLDAQKADGGENYWYRQFGMALGWWEGVWLDGPSTRWSRAVKSLLREGIGGQAGGHGGLLSGLLWASDAPIAGDVT